MTMPAPPVIKNTLCQFIAAASMVARKGAQHKAKGLCDLEQAVNLAPHLGAEIVGQQAPDTRIA